MATPTRYEGKHVSECVRSCLVGFERECVHGRRRDTHADYSWCKYVCMCALPCVWQPTVARRRRRRRRLRRARPSPQGSRSGGSPRGRGGRRRRGTTRSARAPSGRASCGRTARWRRGSACFITKFVGVDVGWVRLSSADRQTNRQRLSSLPPLLYICFHTNQSTHALLGQNPHLLPLLEQTPIVVEEARGHHLGLGGVEGLGEDGEVRLCMCVLVCLCVGE